MPVDESDFSTVFTNDIAASTSTSIPTSAQSNPGASSTQPPSHDHGSGSKGLSTAATAGIGIGVAIGVIFLAVVAFLLWRRRRKTSAPNTVPETADESASHSVKDYKEPQGSAYYAVPTASYSPSELPSAVHDMSHEAPGEGMHHELDATPVSR